MCMVSVCDVWTYTSLQLKLSEAKSRMGNLRLEVIHIQSLSVFVTINSSKFIKQNSH